MLKLGAFVLCVEPHRKAHSGRTLHEGDVGKVTGGGTMAAVDGETWPEHCWVEITEDEWRERREQLRGRRDFYDPPLVVVTPDGEVPVTEFVMP